MPTFACDALRLSHEEFVINHYQNSWGIRTVLGVDERDEGGLYSRARAINNAARAAPDATAFVLADNDVIPDARAFQAALDQCQDEVAVMPHSDTLNLTREATETYKRAGATRGSFRGRAPLVCLIVTRENYIAVNGMDERFRGWGGEDNAFLHALETQLGPVLRLDGVCTHLWHPTDGTKRDRKNRASNSARAEQYRVASRDESRDLSRQYGRLGL